jgi:hypothetical protein
MEDEHHRDGSQQSDDDDRSDDENNEEDTADPLYYDIITHDRGVSIRATNRDEVRWETTPKSLAFPPSLPGYLNTRTTCAWEDLKSRRNTAHIVYFENKRTGSFKPGFAEDTFGKGNKKRDVKGMLGYCKKGTHPWLFREDSRVFRRKPRDAESSV